MTIGGVPHNKPWFSLVSSGVDITGNLHTSKGKAMVSGRFSNSSDLESRPMAQVVYALSKFCGGHGITAWNRWADGQDGYFTSKDTGSDG